MELGRAMAGRCVWDRASRWHRDLGPTRKLRGARQGDRIAGAAIRGFWAPNRARELVFRVNVGSADMTAGVLLFTVILNLPALSLSNGIQNDNGYVTS